MNSAFTYNYELIMSLISELESEINSFVTRPGIDFSRKRKISFQNTILFLLTMRVLELISRTRGIDPLDVLQDKAGSNVLLCETKQEGTNHD